MGHKNLDSNATRSLNVLWKCCPVRAVECPQDYKLAEFNFPEIDVAKAGWCSKTNTN